MLEVGKKIIIEYKLIYVFQCQVRISYSICIVVDKNLDSSVSLASRFSTPCSTGTPMIVRSMILLPSPGTCAYKIAHAPTCCRQHGTFTYISLDPISYALVRFSYSFSKRANRSSHHRRRIAARCLICELSYAPPWRFQCWFISSTLYARFRLISSLSHG